MPITEAITDIPLGATEETFVPPPSVGALRQGAGTWMLFYYSPDQGQTWNHDLPEAPGIVGATGRSDIVQSSTGRLIVVHSGAGTWRYVEAFTSDDEGKIWTGPIQIYDGGLGSNPRYPSIIQAGNGDLLCVFDTGGPGSDVVSRRSTDDGDTWGNPVTIDTDGGTTNVRRDPTNGDLIVTFRDGSNFYYRRSTNDGVSWGARQGPIVTDAYADASGFTIANGGPYNGYWFLVHKIRTGPSETFVRLERSPGGASDPVTWDLQVKIDDTYADGEANFQDIAQTKTGEVKIICVVDDNPGILQYDTYDGGATWVNKRQIHSDHHYARARLLLTALSS